MYKFLKPLAGALLLGSVALPSFAADLDLPPVYEEPAPVAQFSGWYLRGHVGMSNQRFDGLDYEYFSVPGFTQTWLDRGGFSSAPLAGGGIGYEFNDWLRGDVMAEWRGKADFHALDRFTSDATGALIGTNSYTATKSELLLMANAYANLGNFRGISPYVGAGIGASRNTISHFNDSNVVGGGGGFAPRHSQWELAWALHAGLDVDVTDQLTLDLGYSYVNLGDAKTGSASNYNPALTRPNGGFTFNDLTSHDVKLGLRYRFN